MVKELYKHQKRILDLNPERFLIAHDRGAGKTITALALAKKNNVRPLIVVPKPVRKKWHREMVGMGVDGRIMSRDDFRRLATTEDFSGYTALIIDECFVGDTMIHTPLGKTRIDSIERGDKVITATGVGTVAEVRESNTDALYCIRDSRNVTIKVTANHPLLTAKGWKFAKDVTIKDKLVTHVKNLSILQNHVNFLSFF